MIPLGYYIVRKSGSKPRPPWTTPDYLTVAGCLCEGVLPGLESAPFDGEKIQREWDLPPCEARRLYDFTQEHCNINYELFHIFLDYDTLAGHEKGCILYSKVQWISIEQWNRRHGHQA